MIDATFFGHWTIGDFTGIDLVAATINAFAGALLVRSPGHDRGFTVAGVIVLGIIAGIASGIVRDVVLNDVPAALLNPWYLILCTVAAAAAVLFHGRADHARVRSVLIVASVLAVAWYAAVATSKAHAEAIPFPGAIVVGVLGGTASRWIIDVASGIRPLQLVQGASFVGSAALVAVVYIIATEVGLPIWPATLIAVAVGAAFRLTAIRRGYEDSRSGD
jgi:uncharacterized membrane protein YeiH